MLYWTPLSNPALCVFQRFLLSPILFPPCKNAQIVHHLKPSLATLLCAQAACSFHYQSPERMSGFTGPRPPSHTYSFLCSWHWGCDSHGHAGNTPSSLIPSVLMTIQAPLVGGSPSSWTPLLVRSCLLWGPWHPVCPGSRFLPSWMLLLSLVLSFFTPTCILKGNVLYGSMHGTFLFCLCWLPG